ncbi:hypothetical protein CDAR_620121 [Caerostris darwini]|uniref:Uncharacterized protein n=1 Tax=Caerostris darwini TaxID=1538125 RepID=A0AAV4Q2A3_9ARAC|nr:hypothetical protein CDAR_620121 [Caerostris darwini]
MVATKRPTSPDASGLDYLKWPPSTKKKKSNPKINSASIVECQQHGINFPAEQMGRSSSAEEGTSGLGKINFAFNSNIDCGRRLLEDFGKDGAQTMIATNIARCSRRCLSQMAPLTKRKKEQRQK